MNTNFKTSAAVCLLLLSGLVSCKKESSVESIANTPLKSSADVSVENDGNRSENFDSYTHQSTYPESKYILDFGNNSSNAWYENRTMISYGTLRIGLLANAVGSSDGGIIGKTNIWDGTEYETKFKVKFHSGFDWGAGGKVGLGFGMGQVVAGCEGDEKAKPGLGGSARIMWNSIPAGSTNIKFKPYLYYKNMPGDCGGRNETYPATGSLEKDKWYAVTIIVKSNSVDQQNGSVKMYIQGPNDAAPVKLIEKYDICWGSGDTNRKITHMMFDTFRGGSYNDPNGVDWSSGTVGYIYYDDISFRQIAP